jgi:hypothetical protein
MRHQTFGSSIQNEIYLYAGLQINEERRALLPSLLVRESEANFSEIMGQRHPLKQGITLGIH